MVNSNQYEGANGQAGVSSADPLSCDQQKDARTILHVDMDAFFASVEQLDAPNLRGRPVLVGGNGPRGVVAAASYEARAFGCRSAMPMAQAKRACPSAVVMKPRFDRYEEVSRCVMRIFHEATPLVQPLSIDEAFLDVTGSRRLLGSGEAIGNHLRQRIVQELNLTASVGVGPNMFVAKLASDMNKPDGITVFCENDEEALAARLAPLPVERMWGVGPVMLSRLHAHGIRCFGDLQTWDEKRLATVFNPAAARFYDLSYGRDDRPIETDQKAKSIGHEQTFESDLAIKEEIEAVLLRHVERVGTRLRRADRTARNIVIKIRDGEFNTQTRSATLHEATDRTDLLWSAARGLFDEWATKEFRPLRLIGFHAGRFEVVDAGLFEDMEAERGRRLDEATDMIKDRFGDDAIARTASAFPPSASTSRSEGAHRES